MTRDNYAKLRQINVEAFKSASDENAMEVFGECFRDELERLQHAKPSVEGVQSSPPGNLTKENLTPSRLLYGVDHPEVNRTLISLLALKWLLTGDYEAFTSQQAIATRLKLASFNQLRTLVSEVVSDAESLRALAVITVLNDIGKDPALADEVLQHGGRLPHNHNHDDVVYAAATTSMLSLLEVLETETRKDVILGFKMGAKLNIPQLAQAENVPASLRHVLIMRNHERAFELKFLEVLLDVAGAAAQVNARGAIVMTEPVYQGLAVCRRALIGLIRGQQSSREAYDQVLQYRARAVEGANFPLLSINELHERTLLRLLAMGRIATPQQALLYKQAFDNLPDVVRESLCKGMNVDGSKDMQAILPYYAPALFAEAARAAKNVSDQLLVDILTSLMRFLERVYNTFKCSSEDTDEVVECDLYFAHDTVTSDAFLSNPHILDDIALPFE